MKKHINMHVGDTPLEYLNNHKRLKHEEENKKKCVSKESKGF